MGDIMYIISYVLLQKDTSPENPSDTDQHHQSNKQHAGWDVLDYDT